MKFLVSTSLFLLFAGCSAPVLTKGKSVSTDASQITKDCKELGMAYGVGGGDFSQTVSNEKLLEYATNDLRNNAAEKGATHVIIEGKTYDSGGFSSSSGVKLRGAIYKCPTKN